MRRVTGAAVAFALVGLVAACSSSSDDDSSTPATSPPTTISDTISDTLSDTTSDTSPDTTAPPRAPATTDPPATEPPPTEVPAATLPVTDPRSDYPEQPPDVPYPTLEWSVGDLPEGVDPAVLDAAVATAFGEDDAVSRVRSLIVVKGGEIVYERYHPLDSPDQATSSFSVAKSVTSAIVGMLIGDGRLELEAPAPVEEWQAAGDPRQEITLDDLLRMSSGLEWEEEYSASGLPLQMLQAPHGAAVPIAQELVVEPGTVWEYSTGTTAILAEIAADELGGGDALDAYVHERLLDPLGMSSTVLLEDSTGTWFGGLGADSTPRDYARFGLLFLRDGVWDDERILPEGWVDASRSPSSTNPSYGLQWWMSGPPGTFSAEGLFGQRIIVAPEHDMVIVATSTEGGDPFALGNAVYDQFASAG